MDRYEINKMINNDIIQIANIIPTTIGSIKELEHYIGRLNELLEEKKKYKIL